MSAPALPRHRVDLLVVGAGTAGLVGAQVAAATGARVLLVERARFGGDCLWTGCVPSKALLAAAHAAADARAASRYGVHVGDVRVDGPAVLAAVRQAITTIEPVDSPEAVRASGAGTATGDVRFTGRDRAEVDGVPVRFRQALVCTGSAPDLPELPGLADVDPLTTDSLWDLPDLPARLAVLGGGTSGCELAQAFARLGVPVTLVEAADRLLPGEDPAASAVVADALRRDGVDVRTGGAPVRVTGGPQGGTLHLSDGGTAGFTRLLVAVGRTPRTAGLGLDAADVAVDGRGCVVVDDALRTTNPRIWAAGDVTGHPAYTHVAGVHGNTAALNAVLGLRRRIDLSAVPRVTFTRPEVAAVGEPTADPGPDRQVHTQGLDHADRAIAEQATEGFTRLVVDGRHRVRGATVVGPRAGEALAELTLAVSRGLTTAHLTGAVHPYPTYADPQWNAAIADVRARLTGRSAMLAVTALRWVRRVR
ncbi:Pyruvate/2-oxoglutarate dehydrogenase complex, dihydrolipoamide dehydrogenase (E3) component [Blastococcus aggregatus]|uniref:Pyruvate/2-oxoglutarate dehydrogenase complex, dihydrolipoamide dehydrogenase (E3) component n=1 Tax=Blastococcus aggregatus TaxID=38502 RepID=A0A285V0V4_9ACTN|nr:FAD-dependent oxidoreductase [Blastococcus aggregatus]SOC47699.1 Pyruvate/2-oxoglutarate dehydrogenase complex, dihydrolipoamide dehydrogenase (E3) component [Blastococcus aggregatus]